MYVVATGLVSGVGLITFGIGAGLYMEDKLSYNQKKTLKKFSIGVVSLGILSLAMSGGIICCKYLQDPRPFCFSVKILKDVCIFEHNPFMKSNEFSL